MEAKKLKLTKRQKITLPQKSSKPRPYNYSLGRMRGQKQCINGFPNGSLFWDISHCHECWSIYDGPIFVPRPSHGMVDGKRTWSWIWWECYFRMIWKQSWMKGSFPITKSKRMTKNYYPWTKRKDLEPYNNMFKPLTCYWNLFQWWRNMFVR